MSTAHTIPVKINVGLTREETEEFLAHIIETGILNQNSQYVVQRWPGIKEGPISIQRETIPRETSL